MPLEQYSSSPQPLQLAWSFEKHLLPNLSIALEAKARTLRSEPALTIPYSNFDSKNDRVRLVDFGRLVLEQNAWINYFEQQGVVRGEGVVVALPYGPAFLGVTYALFRMGVDVCILDPEFDWKVGGTSIRDFGADRLVGDSRSISLARAFPDMGIEKESFLEVEKPQALVGSAVRSFRNRLTGCDPKEASLTVLRTIGKRCSRISFDQPQLCALAGYLMDWFSLQEGDLALPGNVLEALLFPAAGLSSLIVSDRFSDGGADAITLTLNSISHLDAKMVSGDARFWRSLAHRTQEDTERLPNRFEAVVHSCEASDIQSSGLLVRFSLANFHLIFGSPSCPFIASRSFNKRDREFAKREARGLYRGFPLPGMQVSLLPVRSIRWTDEPGAATPVGEVAIAREDCAPLGDLDYWDGTGELGFFDAAGALWSGGSSSDIVNTGFGGFCPVRCEAVFNRHPRVVKSILITLTKKGKKRAGLVVQTALGDAPKRGVEESRFKAELLQLAADVEETSLILDIFFSDRLPLDQGGIMSNDRRRLSREYSRRIRY